MPSLRAGPVRPLFRALAWVLGPLLMGSGVLMAILDLRGVTASGWPAWSRQLHTGLWLGIGNLAIGWIVFAAGRTGRDPYVVTDEDTSEPSSPDR
jgi:hypothetical protein